jgi:hypothetical protein
MLNEQLVRDFFLAYQQHSYPRMHALLSREVHFSDFAFDIEGHRVFAMWQWFCLPDKNRAPVSVPWFGDIGADGDGITARYRVAYTYGAARRPVDYEIRSRFLIRDQLIIDHHDEGDIRAWSRQAIGELPSRFSRTPLFNWFIRHQAQKKLDAFIANSPPFQLSCT